MLVLTDNPESFDRFLPPGEWERSEPAGLADRDRALWASLHPGSKPWIRQISDEATDYWAILFLISHAPSSQFDALQEMLREDPALPGPVASLALTGNEFHGHRGRHWAVAPGNLHLSAALPVRRPAHGMSAALNMLPAVAAVDAIDRAAAGRIDTGIKWVNDILHDGRKVGGVLAASQVRGQDLESAVLGIGINIAEAPTVPPTRFVPATGCLNEAPGGGGLTLPVLFRELMAALADRYREILAEGAGPLLEAYRRRSVVIGRRVRIWEETTWEGESEPWPEPVAAGMVREIGPDLSLILEGRREPVSRGRLAFEKVCGGDGQ